MAKPDYTLIDYVRWMGAFTFEEKPFCDADALVLCEMIYFEIFDSGTSPGKNLRELIQPAPENDPRAIEVNRIIDEWVEKIPQADRETFVNELFGALEEDGAKTISDLMKNDLDGFEKLIFRVGGTSETTKKAAAALPAKAPAWRS